MSAPSADLADAPRPPVAWPIWLGIACLVAVASPYLIRGWFAWQTQDRVRGVALRFFEDLAAGRKDAALSCLTDEYRSALKAGWKPSFDSSWQPTADVAVQVLSVEQQTNSAAVHVSLTKNGYALKPTLQLRRTNGSDWRIVQIDGIDHDPRWTRRQEREAGEALADELAETLHLAAPSE